MKRRSKLIFSLISLCFSIAVLCFGVYSALSVSYSINGSVSYEINDVFVELDLSVYRALSTTPVNSATHNQNVSTIKDAGDNISETDFGKLSYTDHKSTYEDGVVKPGNEDGIFEADSPDLDLTYGSPTNDNQGYAFYIVIDIHNLGSEIINAQITAPTSLENTILRDSGNVEIAANGTERIVLGLALDDVTKGIISADFTYTITISRGELPIEPITDMTFTVDKENKIATLISYTGSGGDVVIPEKIGYDTTSSKTLTFKTMEDMASNEMNMEYFYQDLYITLPNQEAQPIENPLLWLLGNMESIQATPQNYFPMTIQTVDSYEINQDDYKQYADFGQDMAAMLAFRPIQMIMQNMPLTSVNVQYGTESFTFNMENYNAAMTGEESPTSTAILEFMSKKESAPESLLPVTYSNFEYGFAVKGEEYFVTSIGSSAFADCDALKTVTFGTNSQLESIGPSAFQSCSNLTSIEIPSRVTSIGNYAFSSCSALETVTFGANSQLESIGSYAFQNCSTLEKVTFGENSQLGSIGNNAFSNCSNLTSIEIPSSVTSIGKDAFSGCSALETVTFGESSQLESIGSSAFSSCSKLTSIEIPSSVTSIGDGAFYNCSALETVTFGEGSKLESIGNNAFNNCDALTSIEIPSRVTSIGDGAFYNCSALETVTFGEGSKLEIIGNNAFYNCSNLTSIKIPSRVISIGSSAFSNCSNLTSIEIPSGVTSIGGSTFNNCDALGTVTFGEGSKLESIGNNAFYNCSNLNSIEIPSRVTSIGERAFEGCSALKKVNITDIDAWAMIDFAFSSNPLNYGAGLYLNGELVTEVTLTTATKIGDYAFNRYDSLTSITIPSSVTSIGSDAFNNCSLLGTVTFGEGSKLESIGSSAFSICSNLTSITIPSGVTSIGDSAFYRCTSLTSIEIPSSVTSIGGDAFSFCDALKKVNITDIDAWAMIDFGWRGIKINPLYYGDLYLNGELVTEVTLTTATKIGDYAFYDYDLLTSITIPSSVTSIGDSAFYNCTKLESIAVDQNNSNYSSDEYGVLFNKDKTELIQYPVGNTRTQYTIPSSVTSIGDGAFSNCSALETVTFGEDSKLEIIGNNAFYNCSNLTSIKIPSGVTGIGSSAFYDCSKLSSVYIDGQAVANMLTGTNDPGGLLGNIGTSEKVYINNTLTLTGGAKTYMESNFEIVTSDVSGYVCYQKK